LGAHQWDFAAFTWPAVADTGILCHFSVPKNHLQPAATGASVKTQSS